MNYKAQAVKSALASMKKKSKIPPSPKEGAQENPAAEAQAVAVVKKGTKKQPAPFFQKAKTRGGA